MEDHAMKLIEILDDSELVKCAHGLSRELKYLNYATKYLNELLSMYDLEGKDDKKIVEMIIGRCKLIRGRLCGIFLVSLTAAVFMYKQDTKEMKCITNFRRFVSELG
eukprot:NODE_20_length_39102_cov_0.325513.p19 type:complete len:107 gc:universal NODE_20_length_39102_cov_0.325513:25911-26231(+)